MGGNPLASVQVPSSEFLNIWFPRQRGEKRWLEPYLGVQTKPSHTHRHLFMSLLHQVHKRGKVIILVKDVAVAIAPIQDMVNKPTL